MGSIETRYAGPTDTRPSGVIARSCGGRRIIVAWSHECDDAENHRRAAAALARREGWPWSIVSGFAADGRYVHVMTGRHNVTPARQEPAGAA